MKIERWLLILSLLLSACAGVGQAVPVEEETPTLPTATPQASMVETVPVRETAPTTEAARLAAEQLGVPVTELTFMEVTAVEWTDASLGCPQPGMAYAQVISPGWRFVFTDKEGAMVLLHADRDLKAAVLCEETVVKRAALTTIASQVRDLLAEQLRVAPETLMLISATEMEWADASLGCPQPGMMYAQVITPGYQHIFYDQSGREYDVRTGSNPKAFVLCASGIAGATDEAPPAMLNPAALAARQWLAKQLGVAESNLTIISVKAAEWPDSCLGCPPPGAFCMTVIVPGYQVILQAGVSRYEVRTDRNGDSIAMCQP